MVGVVNNKGVQRRAAAHEDVRLSWAMHSQGIVMRHRPAHFQHLFSSSSYAAAYYVYLWAEVRAFSPASNIFISPYVLSPACNVFLSSCVLSPASNIYIYVCFLWAEVRLNLGPASPFGALLTMLPLCCSVPSCALFPDYNSPGSIYLTVSLSSLSVSDDFTHPGYILSLLPSAPTGA